MTDNEIIKALECCGELIRNPCSQCPYFHEKPCLQLKRDALDLIKRQQAEIEAHKHYYNECLKDLKNAHAEIERLQKDHNDIDKFARDICKERILKGKAIADFEDLQEYIKEQKAEAIKEYEEKLQPYKLHYSNMRMEIAREVCDRVKDIIPAIDDTYIESMVEEHINDLLKEMEKEDGELD